MNILICKGIVSFPHKEVFLCLIAQFDYSEISLPALQSLAGCSFLSCLGKVGRDILFWVLKTYYFQVSFLSAMNLCCHMQIHQNCFVV